MKAKDFKNKRVVVMGLGLHGGGVGTARFMAKAGAKVLVTDLKKEEELKDSLKVLKEFKNIEYVLGQHRMEDFKTADYIIRNPGVPDDSKHLIVARENKIPIENDIGIFFELCKAQIIGVTGSKGKSTTAALIVDVLKTTYQSVFFAGNNRVSVLDVLPLVKKHSLVVLELSSWRLEGLAHHQKSPHVAVVTNIYDEHLNRYKNFKEYRKSKELIFKWQDETDFVFVNKELRELPGLEKTSGRVVFYSGKNEEVAVLVGKIYMVPEEKALKAVGDFVGLPGRMEKVLEKNGVEFVNDTCATHPKAVIRALEALPGKKIVLIAGGADKKSDFSELNNVIDNRVKNLILLPGEASDKIIVKIPVVKVETMAEAVHEAIQVASVGDTVILSPGAASFGLFEHEFQRGEEFESYVKHKKI